MKKCLTVILCLLMICAVFAACKGKPETETETESESVSASEQVTDAPSSAPESTTADESATGETTEATTKHTAADTSFLKKGCWYYYNDAELCAFAFVFDGKGGVSLAYFDPANVTGEDPQFFEGAAKYSVQGSQLKITSLPSALGLKEFVFDVTENGLSYQGTALEQQDRISLDYAFNHFNS